MSRMYLKIFPALMCLSMFNNCFAWKCTNSYFNNKYCWRASLRVSAHYHCKNFDGHLVTVNSIFKAKKLKEYLLHARSLPYDISDECLLLAVVAFYWDAWYPVRVNINGLDIKYKYLLRDSNIEPLYAISNITNGIWTETGEKVSFEAASRTAKSVGFENDPRCVRFNALKGQWSYHRCQPMPYVCEGDAVRGGYKWPIPSMPEEEYSEHEEEEDYYTDEEPVQWNENLKCPSMFSPFENECLRIIRDTKTENIRHPCQVRGGVTAQLAEFHTWSQLQHYKRFLAHKMEVWNDDTALADGVEVEDIVKGGRKFKWMSSKTSAKSLLSKINFDTSTLVAGANKIKLLANGSVKVLDEEAVTRGLCVAPEVSSEEQPVVVDEDVVEPDYYDLESDNEYDDDDDYDEYDDDEYDDDDEEYDDDEYDYDDD